MYCNILETNSSQWREILKVIKHDIYQLPEYVALEAKRTNTIPQAFLAVENDKIFFVSYLLRSCQNIINKYTQFLSPEQRKSRFATEAFDVISPYGYPGILLNEAAQRDSNFCNSALEKFRNSLQEQKICSGFFRLHPILNENWHQIFAPDTFLENGTTVSIDLTSTTEEIWNHTKSSHRNKINRSTKKFGLMATITKVSQEIDKFCQLYEETMARVIANDIYYSFNKKYFQQMAATIEDHLYLYLIKAPSEEIVSAGLYTECGGIVQAAFGGISNNFVKQSPSILEIDTVRWWAKEQVFNIFI